MSNVTPLPVPDFMRDYEREAKERAARNEALIEKIRMESATVTELCASAIKYPVICRRDLEKALRHLSVALVAAHELDPEG